MAAIVVMDGIPQFEALQELAALFADRGDKRKGASHDARRAVVALHEAAALCGRPPSVEEYRELCSAYPGLALPSDTLVRRWLGGRWADCLHRANLSTSADPDCPSRAVSTSGPSTSSDVRVAAASSVEELLHVPSVTEYLAWSNRPDVQSRPGRRPRTESLFQRYGGYEAALQRAGLISDGDIVGTRTGPCPARYAYSDQQLTDALRFVAQRIGHSPRYGEYRWERGRIRRQREDLLVPCVEVLRSRFGSWNNAVAAAGLDPPPPFRPAPGQPFAGSLAYSNEDIRSALTLVAESLGRSPRYVDYRCERARLRNESGTARFRAPH